GDGQIRTRRWLAAEIGGAKRVGHPPATAPAVENMGTDNIGHDQALAPARPDRLRMIMGCEPDAGKDRATERCRRDAACAQPAGAAGCARHGAVAGKAELADARTLRSLEDDAADGVGKARVTNAIENH